ncbi:MAG: PQQ-binding-like beta-propeller repeat protein [Myxococcota bacterium]
MTQRAPLLILALAIGCGEDPPPASGTTTGAEPGSTTAATTVVVPGTSTGDVADDSTSGGESSGGSTTTGADPCAESPEPGRPANWNRYGLDNDNSRFNALESQITAANVHCLQSRWSLDDLVGVTSTPAVVDDVVYFGEWDGEVHALEAADGSVVWTANVGAQVNDSPLVEEARVYVGDAEGFVHALDRGTGEIQWSVELDAHTAAGIYSSPVLADGVLVIGVSSVELATALDDYTFRGSIVGLNPDTGEELWRFYTADNTPSSGAGASIWSSAAVDEARGWIYIGSGNAYEEPAGPLSDSVIALEAATGELQWSTQFTADDVFTIFGPAANGADSDVGAAPNLFTTRDMRDLVGVGDKAGYYRALDRDTGDIVWMNEVGPGSPLGGIMTSAAVADGVIYVSSNEWAALYDFGNTANSAMTVAISADDGVTLWETPNDAPIFGALTVAGGVVYHGTVTGDLVALDTVDGAELWRTEPGHGLGGGFSVVNGMVFAGHGFWFLIEPANPFGGFVAYGLP